MTRPRPRRLRARAIPLVAAALLPACGDDPVEVVFQVIEETEFADTLMIDLAAMEQLPSGVYREDVVVGTGAELVDGVVARVSYTGWLADATQFGTGEFSFLTGNDDVVPGFEEGMLGTLVGGSRRLVIPPEQAYGASAREARQPDGSIVLIPGGSILVFSVELLEIL